MSRLHIDPWDLLREQEFRSSTATFDSRPDAEAITAEAARRGYRRITLTEQMDAGKVDAYSWRGGVWVRDALSRGEKHGG